MNRDYNGGLGTGFTIGTTLGAKALELLRRKMEHLPYLLFGYLAAIFSKRGFEVEVVWDEIPSEGLVILAPSLANFNADLALLKRAHAKDGVTVGVVGTLASTWPHLFEEFADFVVVGEGEQFALEFDPHNLPKGNVPVGLVEDLDALPFPSWDKFPLTDQSYYFALPEKPFTFVITSRSCPYKCGYCPYIVDTKYRKRSIENVIQELEWLVSEFGVRGVVFRDPTFTLSKARTIKLCEEMIARKLPIRWVCETRTDCVDPKLLAVMKRAGLRAIKFGIESSSAAILKDADRIPHEVAQQEAIIRECDKLGIRVIGFYILGLPSDTKDTIAQTIAYAKRLNTFIAQFHICTPLPGTPFYYELKDRIFETDLEKFNNFEVVFRHDHLDKDELLKLRERAFVSYYFRPRYIASFLRRTLTA